MKCRRRAAALFFSPTPINEANARMFLHCHAYTMYITYTSMVEWGLEGDADERCPERNGR